VAQQQPAAPPVQLEWRHPPQQGHFGQLLEAEEAEGKSPPLLLLLLPLPPLLVVVVVLLLLPLRCHRRLWKALPAATGSAAATVRL